MCHYECTHPSENDDPVKDKEDVVPTKSESGRTWIVVGYSVELGCIMSGGGKHEMDCKERGEEIECNACEGRSVSNAKHFCLKGIPI